METDDESKNPIVDLPNPLPQETQKPRPQISREKASPLTPFKLHYFAKNFTKKTRLESQQIASNWLNGEMARLMNNDEITNMRDTKVTPESLATLVEKFRKRELNNNAAKQVFEAMYIKGAAPEEVIELLGLGMVSGADSLGPIINEVIANNEKAVNDYLGGTEASLKFLVGQVMKATRGQADAVQATEMIKKILTEK